MRKFYLVLLTVFFLFSCSNKSTSPTSFKETKNIKNINNVIKNKKLSIFEMIDTRKYKSHFSNWVELIQIDKDNSTWILHNWKEYIDDQRSSTLQKINNNHKIEITLNNYFMPKDAIIDFVIHPSGVISALVFYPDESNPEQLSKAYLMKIGKNGEILFISNLPTNESYLGGENFKLKSFGEDLIILSLSYPTAEFILFRLNDNFQLIWNKKLRSKLKGFYGHIELKVDKSIYAWIPNKKDRSTLYVFNQNGEKIIEKNKVNIELSFNTCIVDDENYFYYSDTKKSDQKILVKAIDKKTFQIRWQQQFSFHPLEHINTLLVQNNLLVMGGASGYTQATKGGSIMSYSKAILVFLDKMTGTLSKMKNNPYIIGTNRRDEIYTLCPINNDEFLVGGIENGPITHDSAKKLYSTGFTFKIRLIK